MTSPPFTVVRFSLALHVGADPEAIRGDHHLDADLGLDPLDLVLIALRLEEVEGLEFPIADLDGVETVDDLTDVVARWTRPRARTAVRGSRA